MVNYQHGKIYSIRSYQTDLIYIGSSCSLLSKRFSRHKTDYKNWVNDNSKAHTTSIEILKYDDAYIELICACPCYNKLELSREEGMHIRKTNNCVNKRIAGRTKQEYYFDNQDKINQYYIDNQAKIKQYQKQNYINNQDKIKKQMKQYYIDNQAKLKQYQKQNYEKKKAISNEILREEKKQYQKKYYEKKKALLQEEKNKNL